MVAVLIDKNLRTDVAGRARISEAFSLGEPVTLSGKVSSSAAAGRSIRLVALMTDTELHARNRNYWRGMVSIAKLLALFFRCGDLGGLCVEARAAGYRFDAAVREETDLCVTFECNVNA